MKTLNLATLSLIVLGGLNWGIFALTGIDVVLLLFGTGSWGSEFAYLLIGVSALYQIIPLTRSFSIDEEIAEVTTGYYAAHTSH